MHFKGSNMSAPNRKRARAAKRPGVSRRLFLKGLGFSGSSSLLLSACGGAGDNSGNLATNSMPDTNTNPSEIGGSCPATPAGLTPSSSIFAHGVASGDPTANSVIFWTRVSEQTAPVDVTLEIFKDVLLTQLQTTRCVKASSARDYTVKLDVDGLEPGTIYYYRFSTPSAISRTGRTQTAPTTGASGLKFGVVSCSSLAHGFFNSYAQLCNRKDINAIIHLGDYIYEYASGEYGDVRPYEPATEIKSLSDYRTRHSHYKKTDPDLQNLHSLFPFITIWDDHESANNSYRDGAENHTEGAEGSWSQRKGWAQQAYDEWMPIRLPEAGNPNKIWRRLRYGNLVDMFMLDTRLFDRDLEAATPVNPTDSTARAEDRNLLGKAQLAWLSSGLQDSTAKWKVVGSQVVFHQWTVKPGPDGKVPSQLQGLVGPSGLNGDAWDGYVAERKRVTAVLSGANGKKKIDNTVILTGDVHSSWVADITDDPNDASVYNPLNGSGSLAVEFVGPSVTSPGLPIPNQVVDGFRAINPHIKYINMADNGYMLVSFTEKEASCEYWYVSTIAERGGSERMGKKFTVLVGENKISGTPGLSA
jgi:alkaline phosphatase D